MSQLVAEVVSVGLLAAILVLAQVCDDAGASSTRSWRPPTPQTC